MNESIVQLGTSIFLFYLLISSNFLGSLYGCRTQYMFSNNMLLKHFIGLFTFYISVVLISKDGKSPFHNLAIAIGLYSFFVLTTRCDSRVFVVILTILFGCYLLSKIKEYYYPKKDSEGNKKIIHIQKIFYILVIILTILGSIIYLGRKKIEYGKDFNYYRFIVGSPECKFKEIKETFDKNTYIKLFKTAFT